MTSSISICGFVKWQANDLDKRIDRQAVALDKKIDGQAVALFTPATATCMLKMLNCMITVIH